MKLSYYFVGNRWKGVKY